MSHPAGQAHLGPAGHARPCGSLGAEGAGVCAWACLCPLVHLWAHGHTCVVRVGLCVHGDISQSICVCVRRECVRRLVSRVHPMRFPVSSLCVSVAPCCSLSLSAPGTGACGVCVCLSVPAALAPVLESPHEWFPPVAGLFWVCSGPGPPTPSPSRTHSSKVPFLKFASGWTSANSLLRWKQSSPGPCHCLPIP